MTALQIEIFDLVTKASFILNKYLWQNSAAGFPFNIDGIANTEVWEEENHIWQLATSSCGHSRRDEKLRFYYSFNHR